jgi:hypothetical protein
MTKSNNINHLTFNTEFSPEKIVEQIRNNIKNTDMKKKEKIMINPKTASTTTTDPQEYPEDSSEPVAQNFTPPYATGSPYVGEIPENTFSDSLRREIYGTPTPEKPEFNELSKQAREYTVGEQVHYRGDENPNRLWNVTNIGDRFLKIETNTPGLKDLDTVKLVTALDIYKVNKYDIYKVNDSDSDFSKTPPPPPPLPDSMNSDSSMEGGGIKTNSHTGIHQPPPINIKIINNGNDFSSDNDAQNDIQNSEENNNKKDVVSFNPNIESESQNPHVESSNTSTELDFNNLVIKKV